MDKRDIAAKTMETLRELEEQERKDYAGNRDQVLMDHFLKEDGVSESKNTIYFKNPDIPWTPTDKFRVAMVMAPAWAINFPPYSTAKLTALMRQYEYSVKVYDVNVEAYHWFLENHGQDYWTVGRHFLWLIKDRYDTILFQDLKPMLDKTVESIINSDVRVVGFSLYYTSLFSTIYIAKRIRELNPNICLIVGGPETITGISKFHNDDFCKDLFNYIFVGESEDNLINLLENLPAPESLPINEIVGTVNSRLTLNDFPFADYSDYDIRNYNGHGVCMESSRGCIAKCSFCAETHFWKFRSIDPIRIVDEIEHYVTDYKVKRIWLVDSLANGNLKNFEEFIDELLKRKLNVRWHTMARCDGRMDFIFIRKAVASGCTALAFGVESGSQKVLHDMRKKVEVWEIEQNLRDARKAGLYNHCTWMVGFPTEEHVDFFHSMQVMYNARYWLETVSVGHTFQMQEFTHIATNYADYGIVGNGESFDFSTLFLNQWYTYGLKNTVLQRFVRMKFTYVWLEILKDFRKGAVINVQIEQSLKHLYSLDVDPNKNYIDYFEQDFNVNFDQFTGGTLSEFIANEYVGICYLLYKCFNKLTFTYKFIPDEDLKIFGDLLVRDYNAEVYFNIDKRGNYTLRIDHKFVHGTKEEYLKEQYAKEITQLGDQSFEEIIERSGHISDWQTAEPIVRETIHPQYRKK